MYHEGKAQRAAILASAYFPYLVSLPPTLACNQLVELSELQRLNLLLGVDANAHHETWGSTDTNPRGECLLNYLVSKGLIVLNEGSEPTFLTRSRAEVLDLTVASPALSAQVVRWHVSEEPSHSDHRYIYFEVSGVDKPDVTYQNPRKTNWAKYRQFLESEIRHKEYQRHRRCFKRPWYCYR
uniref:Endonuclease/exonuclease/phosphatase domain-containing protein n=1 Tax=Cacopsylla melanoneura TaxID=428564 RepID=A0A8D9A0P7_9HEMI